MGKVSVPGQSISDLVLIFILNPIVTELLQSPLVVVADFNVSECLQIPHVEHFFILPKLLVKRNDTLM